MKAVLEEIEAGIACFIPDDQSDAVYIEVRKLPRNLKIGQLYEVTPAEADGAIQVKPLEEEQEKREERIKSKREKLLKRRK